MAWDERWEKWRRENTAELKLLRELVIKLRREQLERSAAEARARTVNSGALQEAME
jgi:hypothetical protein